MKAHAVVVIKTGGAMKRYAAFALTMIFYASILPCPADSAPQGRFSVLQVDNVLKGDGIPYVDVRAYGADSTGATDIYTSLNAAIDAINTAGHGVLVFPPGTYKIFADNSVGSPTAFNNIDGLTILASGAKFVQGFTMNTGESRSLFKFTGTANNISIPYLNFSGSVSQAQASSGSFTGTHAVYFAGNTGGGENISIGQLKVVGAGSALQMGREYTEPTTNIIKNVRLGNVSADNSVYGVSLNNTGWNTTIDSLKTNWVHRSLFMWGLRGIRANIDSLNNQGNDLFLNADAGMGIEDADITYRNIGSTLTANDAASRIYLSFNTAHGGGAITHKNIHIKTHQDFPTGGETGWNALQFARTASDDAIVHVLENFKFEGHISGASTTSGQLIYMNSDYNWTNGRFSNVTFGPLIFDNVTGGTYLISDVFSGGIAFDRVRVINSTGSGGAIHIIQEDGSRRKTAVKVYDCDVPNLNTYFAGPIPPLKTLYYTADNSAIPIALCGETISNEAGSGTLHLNLEAIAPGCEYTFIDVLNQPLRIRPDGTDTIGSGGAGKYMQIPARGTATIRASTVVTSTNWNIVSFFGDNTAITYEP